MEGVRVGEGARAEEGVRVVEGVRVEEEVRAGATTTSRKNQSGTPDGEGRKKWRRGCASVLYAGFIICGRATP